MLNKKYSDYIEISPTFESVVDIDADSRNKNLWREYIVGDDMEKMVEVLCQSLNNEGIDSEGNDITRSFAVEGSLFMDEGFYGYNERFCMWEVLEDSTVMICETSKVRELILGNNAFKDLWIILLEQAVRYKLYRENGFLVENATERYIHFRKIFPDLASRISQKHIATYLGITPESLSRIRSSLKDL